MQRDTAAIIISTAIAAIFLILGVVLKAIPMWIAIIIMLVCLAVIIWGAIMFKKGRYKMERGDVNISDKAVASFNQQGGQTAHSITTYYILEGQ